MEIIKKVALLKNSIEEMDNLVDGLISNLQTQKLRVENKEKKISSLKDEIKNNINKIDHIIENYNANS